MKNSIPIIAAIVALVFFQSCISENSNGDGIENYVVVGDAVPTFTVTSADGTGSGKFESGWFQGKRSIIVFFRSGCPDCQREMPKVHSAWKELHDNYEFILVSRGESTATVEEYWESVEADKPSFVPMPYYLDPSATAFNVFANSYVPRIYLVGIDGKVKHMEIETFSFKDGQKLISLINDKL